MMHTWIPEVSSSKPNAMTTLRAGWKSWLSSVSTVDLSNVYVNNIKRQDAINTVQHTNQSTFIVRGSTSPDMFPFSMFLDECGYTKITMKGYHHSSQNMVGNPIGLLFEGLLGRHLQKYNK